ncbi:MAG TPA: peptidylprolyl isomerase [Gemmatimonadales bacterium]
MTLGALAFLLAVQAPVPAPRAATDSVVDRIVAVVGSRAILSSNIEERILLEHPQGKNLPPTPEGMAQLRRDLLQVLVDEELMVQEAAKDTTIKVPDDDVTKSVDLLLKTTRARYATEEEYRKDIRAAGFETVDEYRSWLSEQQRRRLQINQLTSHLKSSGKLKEVAPTEKEIRDYFDKYKASFPKRPETVTFRQIVIAPPAKAEAKARARAVADSILVELRKGADFATAARRFSMDPTSKELGGSLGWVRRGQGLDQKFEDMAFMLRPGVVSDPVETSFGFHLIQVERAQPAEVQVRHILIMPAVDTADADSALRVARRVHDAIEAGASFDSAQRIWHDKVEEREVPPIPLENLPAAYGEALTGVSIGKVAPVFRLDAPVDLLRSKYVVALITDRTPAGEVRYEDVKEQIRSGLGEQLTTERYTDRLRRATLVELRNK